MVKVKQRVGQTNALGVPVGIAVVFIKLKECLKSKVYVTIMEWLLLPFRHNYL